MLKKLEMYGDIKIFWFVFIELEYAEKIPEAEIPEITAIMEQFLLQELKASVEPRDRRGYPYQMMALKGLL